MDISWRGALGSAQPAHARGGERVNNPSVESPRLALLQIQTRRAGRRFGGLVGAGHLSSTI
jgi:hypothetical protein